MSNFYVDLAAHDLVSDAGTTTTYKREIKPMIMNKSTKNEESFENMGFNGKTVWRFQTKKKNRNIILDLSKKISGTAGR